MDEGYNKVTKINNPQKVQASPHKEIANKNKHDPNIHRTHSPTQHIINPEHFKLNPNLNIIPLITSPDSPYNPYLIITS